MSSPHFNKKIGMRHKTVALVLLVAAIVVATKDWFRISFCDGSLPRELYTLDLYQYTLPGLQEKDLAAHDTQTKRHEEIDLHHNVQCRQIPPTETSAGSYINTSTNPPFLMNTHDPTVDVAVSASIARFGVFEGPLVQELTSSLTNAGPLAVLIDIGSNIGMYSFAAAANGHQVIAFEPVKANWMRMCNTANANEQLRDNLNLYKVAVVNHPNLVAIGEVPKSNPGHVVLHDLDVDANGDMEEGRDFAWGFTLDSIQNVLPLDRPVVIKLDTEGSECNILEGGLDYLSKANLVYVQMEVSRDSFNRCPHIEDVIAIFVSKRLTPIFYYSPGTSLSKELDPSSWKQWFGEPNFVIGNIVWKRRELKTRERNTKYLTFSQSNYGFLRSPFETIVDLASISPLYPSLCAESIVPEISQQGDEAEPYDVIILDYDLPLQGLTLLAVRLRQRFPYAIIILVRYWYPYQVYTSSSGKMESLRQWAERRGYFDMNDPLFQRDFLSSKEEWQWSDSSETYKVQDEVVKTVDGHIISIAKPSDPREIINNLSWFSPDWLHLSETGHAFVGQRIWEIVDSIGVAVAPRLGVWTNNDSCHSWFHDGQCPLPYSSNIEMEQFDAENERHALRIPPEGGTITVTNPMDKPRELTVSYMATGPPPAKYPKTLVIVEGNPTASVVLDPMVPPEWKQNIHVALTTSVGMIEPGENVVSFFPLDTTLYPLRVIAAAVTQPIFGFVEPFGPSMALATPT